MEQKLTFVHVILDAEPTTLPGRIRVKIEKGRDLFDLWLVVDRLRHYMKDAVFTHRELAVNLQDKLEDADFRADLDPLVLEVPDGYTVDRAADLVMEQLGALRDNAPDRAEIDVGAWRR